LVAVGRRVEALTVEQSGVWLTESPETENGDFASQDIPIQLSRPYDHHRRGKNFLKPCTQVLVASK
jgi:hypothetical protein